MTILGYTPVGQRQGIVMLRLQTSTQFFPLKRVFVSFPIMYNNQKQIQLYIKN